MTETPTHLFISHANPEDNDFARWLTLRLAAEGYPVWCDLTKLLGGESFWTDIEIALRNDTIRFLLVTSRASNQKGGVRDELHLANTVAKTRKITDFVIPLLIDDLPTSELNIELGSKNAIPFQTWETGLAQLLDKLQRVPIAKDQRYSPAAVASWWHSHASQGHILTATPETYLSNLFPITNVPDTLYLHSGRAFQNNPIGLARYPVHESSTGFLSFATLQDLNGDPGLPGLAITRELSIKAIRAKRQHSIRYTDVRALLRRAWEHFTFRRGFQSYDLAGRTCAYVPNSLLPPTGNAKYRHPAGQQTYRTLVGTSEARHLKWHYALSATITETPALAVTLSPHVIFSDHAGNVWPSPDRQQHARRSVCKTWWNDHWCDRTLATVQLLAGGNQPLHIPLSSTATMTVNQYPIPFLSPVTYDAAAPTPYDEPDDEEES